MLLKKNVKDPNQAMNIQERLASQNLGKPVKHGILRLHIITGSPVFKKTIAGQWIMSPLLGATLWIRPSDGSSAISLIVVNVLLLSYYSVIFSFVFFTC